MAPPVLRPLSTGEVLDVSFGLYRSIFAPLFLVTAVTSAIPTVLGIIFGFEASHLIAHPFLLMGYLVLALTLRSVGQAGVTIIISDAYLGQQTTPMNALRRALPLIWRLFLIATMFQFIFVFGIILLVVPGLIAGTGLCLSTVVAVIEGTPSAGKALDRSWALTRGFRTKALVVLLVPLLLAIVIPGMIGPILMLTHGKINLAIATGVGAVIGIFFYPFLYAVLAVLYYDLRVRKEGLDLEILASTIQA